MMSINLKRCIVLGACLSALLLPTSCWAKKPKLRKGDKKAGGKQAKRARANRAAAQGNDNNNNEIIPQARTAAIQCGAEDSCGYDFPWFFMGKYTMCSSDGWNEVCTSDPQDWGNRGYTCGACDPENRVVWGNGDDKEPEAAPSTHSGLDWGSPYREMVWQEACKESSYDYVATLKFCQDGGEIFGYRLNDWEPCGELAPLIRLQAGKKYQLRLMNQADEATNLHTHGLHIPGAGNSDNVQRIVEPGNCLLYNWTIPADHMDGTFWYHAHLRHKTRVHVNGGALGVLIVDPAEDRPPRPSWVENNERILLITTVSRGGFIQSDVTMANFKEQETMKLKANKWHHLRVAVADPRAKMRDIVFDESRCEVRAAAYDGVWRTTVPHPEAAAQYTVSGANRIDFAIKCSASSGLFYDTKDIDRAEPLVVFDVIDPPDSDKNDGTDALTFWEPPRPLYLQNLHDGSDMETTFDVSITVLGINGKLYNPEVPLATFEHGSIQQWNIRWSNWHPFHLHLYHMQIVTPGGCGHIYEEGQWYDSIASVDDECMVRFRLLDIGGQAILHCHKLLHEDLGVMGWVEVANGPLVGVENIDQMNCRDQACYDKL